jgi:alpha-glucosidase
VERVLSRWGRAQPTAALANLFTALACSLRGSVCIYQGEELGLTEAQVPFESLKDPYGIAFWPQFKGRDGCRTPMPWNGDVHAGFSHGEPWLPVAAEHRERAVARQEADPGSALHGFRRVLRWRSGQPALRWGDIRFLETPEPVLAFTRSHGSETMLAAFNLGPSALEAELALDGSWHAIDGHGLAQGAFAAGRLQLPGHGVVFARLA